MQQIVLNNNIHIISNNKILKFENMSNMCTDGIIPVPSSYCSRTFGPRKEFLHIITKLKIHILLTFQSLNNQIYEQVCCLQAKS